MEKLSIVDLCADDGFNKLVSILDEELLQPEIEQAVEDWDNLENRSKKDSETIEEFVNDFERLLARVESKGAKLPACVKCFMMLKRIRLSHEEILIVMSKLDFDEKENLFSDVKKCLKLLKGKTMAQSQPDQTVGEVYFSQRDYGRGRGKTGFTRNENSRPGGGTWNNNTRGSGTSGTQEQRDGRKRSASGSFKKKRLNPTGADGNVRRCKSCDSIRHMLSDCPDSWENMRDIHVTELETVSETNEEEEIEECFITENNYELKRFCVEAKNCAALDSCCTK